MFILSIKKNTIIAIITMIALLSLFFYLPASFTITNLYSYTVVIDAGHGGFDGGKVGTMGTNESELNLLYAFELKQMLEEIDINVVLTRDDENALHGMFSDNKKKDDMLARKQIIDNSNADMVVSLHMNSFPLKTSCGAQCFYKEENEASVLFANCVQKCLIDQIPNARQLCLKGDYYILNCTDKPAIIVECGFLSNSDEEKLLLTENYRKQLCYAIFCGIMSFLAQ